MEQFRVSILVNNDLPDLSIDSESNTGTNIDENLQLSLNEIYGMSCKNVWDYMEDMGSFALNLLQNMEENDIQRLLQSVASRVAILVEQLDSVVARRDSDNNVVDCTPPVLRNRLVSTRGKEFAALIEQQRQQLLQSFTPDDIKKIEDDFRALNIAYSKEEGLRTLIDWVRPNESFEAAWQPMQD